MENEECIFSTGGERSEDFPNLLEAARKAVGLGYKVYILPNPKGITLRNPQETDTQHLVDFSFYTMHHICTTNFLLLSNAHGLQNPLYQGV